MQLTHSQSVLRTLSMLLASSLLAGCSWFSWLPWVGDDDDEKAKLKPSELVKFDAEIEIERLWRSGVGEGLGRKYLRMHPALIADLVIAADGYGVVQANDRFSGKRIWHVFDWRRSSSSLTGPVRRLPPWKVFVLRAIDRGRWKPRVISTWRAMRFNRLMRPIRLPVTVYWKGRYARFFR